VARTVLRGPRRSNAPGPPDNRLHWVRDVVRHEALLNRAVMRGHRPRLVV